MGGVSEELLYACSPSCDGHAYEVLRLLVIAVAMESQNTSWNEPHLYV